MNSRLLLSRPNRPVGTGTSEIERETETPDRLDGFRRLTAMLRTGESHALAVDIAGRGAVTHRDS